MLYFHFLILIVSSLFQTAPTYDSYASHLSIGELLEFEGKAIEFKEIISDSRCPTGVTCIWAGEAKVLVEITDQGQLCGEQVLTISGGGEPFPLQQLFPELIGSLLVPGLMPYPDIKKEIQPKDYRLDLEVRVDREE